VVSILSDDDDDYEKAHVSDSDNSSQSQQVGHPQQDAFFRERCAGQCSLNVSRVFPECSLNVP
jgi:hypothetical protein